MSALPIAPLLPRLLSLLLQHNQCIIKAAPGAGKSTYLPLTLLKESKSSTKKIIMMEPRRLAVRNIANYLASQLDESVGETVGYRMRGDTKISANTRLEIVTEGVMTRMIQADPELSEVDLVIFDEFHERSIHADTALAFCLEIQQVFRDDLKLIVMSATLDQTALCALLPDAQYLESQGRQYPIEYRYSPLKPNQYLLPNMVTMIHSMLTEQSGSILVFLSGVGEIQNIHAQLQTLMSAQLSTGSPEWQNVEIFPLYGQLDIRDQQRAIKASSSGMRKVVLATNIAETSLTIDGVNVVIDSGLERVARFDTKTGITKLDQSMIAQSSAQQRAGRAGRLEAGTCIRMYSQERLMQQDKVPQAEILRSDLTNLQLELSQWGASHANELSWLDLPPEANLQQASQLLSQLGLITEYGQLSPAFQSVGSLGLPPRFTAMILNIQALENRDLKLDTCAYLNTAFAIIPLLEEPEKKVVDLAQSVHKYYPYIHLSGTSNKSQHRFYKRSQMIAQKMNCQFELNKVDSSLVGVCVALAFPDRIAQQRMGSGGSGHSNKGKFLLANGHGAIINELEPLSGESLIVAINLLRQPKSSSSQIHLAVKLDHFQLNQSLSHLVKTIEVVKWDEVKGKMLAEQHQVIGQLILAKKKSTKPSSELIQQAMIEHIKKVGLSVLSWNAKSEGLLTRMRNARDWLVIEADKGIEAKQVAKTPQRSETEKFTENESLVNNEQTDDIKRTSPNKLNKSVWPDVSDKALLKNLNEWLTPYLNGIETSHDLKKINLYDALMAYLGWPLNQQINTLLPSHYQLPTGTRKAIRYQDKAEPVLSVRMQEMFGESDSPLIANGHKKLVVELLSPAQRPLQITQDLAGFWQGSYKEVQKEMKGRYPKHVWPDDPANHIATSKTKRALERKP